MKKKAFISLLALSLLLVPAFAMAADSTMRVIGNAVVTAAPDLASMDIGFQAQEADAAAAQKKVAETIDKIKTAVTLQGVSDDDIKTAYLSIYPSYDYSEGDSKINGYRVEHMLTISIKEIDKIGAIMDAALGVGANQNGSISYSASNESELYQKALAAAVEDASAKADTLAIAAGVWLGQLLQVNEQPSQMPYFARSAGISMDAAAMSSVSLGDTLTAGEIEISASVELLYSIR